MRRRRERDILHPLSSRLRCAHREKHARRTGSPSLFSLARLYIREFLTSPLPPSLPSHLLGQGRISPPPIPMGSCACVRTRSSPIVRPSRTERGEARVSGANSSVTRSSLARLLIRRPAPPLISPPEVIDRLLWAPRLDGLCIDLLRAD